MYDLFWIIRKTEIPSYADQNAPYVSDDSIVDVIKSLQNDSLNLFKWFPNNSMKTNSDKCHLLTNKKSSMNLKTGNTNIENSNRKNLWEIKADNKPKFTEHLNGIIE